jgi:hypothetical protein
MSWLLWRQHRLQVAIAAALLAAFGLAAWITGDHLASNLRACQGDATCGGFNLFRGYNWMVTLVDVTVLVPLLIGVFWGATIVGRELEAGTAILTWTQSVTRRHWLRTKVLTLFVFAAACSGGLTALTTWWSRTRNATVQSRFGGFPFDIQGVVPIGYTLFAAALGLAAGVLWRRTLPAMATTVGVFIALRLIVDSFARPHYLAPVTWLTPLVGPDALRQGSWQISNELSRHGQVLTGPISPPAGCAGAGSRSAMDTCMSAHGYRMKITYQPASRFWTFQWIEFGIFAGLAVILVAVAVVVLRRHDA